MPYGTITSTENTFGTVNGALSGTVAGTLTGSVGVPGPVGPTGPQGPEGPPGPPGEGGVWGSIVGTLSAQLDLQAALDLKAPIASPVFTGDARAVTPAFGDNDTSISTTAFVQAALAGGTAVAKNLEVYVRNQSGSTVPAGSIVYISGATGNTPLITLAQANNDANSAQTIGFVKETIANNGFGYVIVRGDLENIDTSALTEGVQLYLSPTTAGAWTTTKPSAPQHLVYVGIVVRAHPTQGKILVAVQNGYELDELHTVSLTSPANNDLLAYESSSSLWKNKSFGTLGLLTSSAAASTYYPLTGNPSSFLTASALTGYATESWVSSGFATTARGLPSSGTIGQFLVKNSGTDYDVSWATFVPGDRYLSTSTTSVTIGTGTKTLTIGTGLSYTTQQDIVIAYDATNHMHALVTSYNSGTGVLVAEVQSFSGSGTYTSWTVNVGGTTPLQTVEWGEILGTLGDQSDLATALNAKLESATAATTYAALAGATFTGEVVTPASTTSNAGLRIVPGVAPTSPVDGSLWATTSDLQVQLNGVTETIAEQSWVTSQGYITSSALTPYAPLAGATFTGKVNFAALTTSGAINIPHVASVSTPVNGDLWTTTSGFFFRINGVNRQAVDIDGTQTISGAKTFSASSLTFGNSTTAGTINIGTGAVATGGKAINIGTGGAAGSSVSLSFGTAGLPGNTTFNGNGSFVVNNNTVNIHTNTATSGATFAGGATISGSTKTVAIGTGGVAGSTTNINLGTVDGGAATVTTNALLVTRASATTGSGLRVPHGAAPTSPTNGDIWTDTAGVYARINGTTQTLTPPTAATVAEAKLGNDTAKFINCNVLQKVVNSPSYYKFPRGVMSTATSGTGASVTAGALITWLTGTTTGAGWAQHEYYGFSGVDIINNTGWQVGSGQGMNFGKQFRMTGSTNLLGPMPTNTIVRCMFGKQANDAGGDPTTRCIGWRYNQATGFIEIIAHNGTSLVTLTTASNPVSAGWFEWELYNNGSGSVEMFVNDVSIGTLTGGPTTSAFSSSPTYVEEIQTTATPSAQPSVRFRNGGLFLQP